MIDLVIEQRRRDLGGGFPVLGLVINPVAGMGGRVGLKGSDGLSILNEAGRRGATPAAQDRARAALDRLNPMSGFCVVTASDGMGEAAARSANLEVVVVHRTTGQMTSAFDTMAAAQAMVAARADLILFVGGDGTARDVLAATGGQVPMLGVPAGVKMHSAVFGTTPANAGHLATLFLDRSSRVRLRDAEVMDLDEDAIRAGRVSAHLYGYARSPYERRLVQNAKAGSVPGEDEALDAAAREVAARMKPGRLYMLGPGTTTRRVADALNIPSTLLGVDAVLDGQAIGLDLDEQALLRAMDGREAELIVGVLGGQGSLFGRGNQQISANVIRRVGRDGIHVISTIQKLVALSTGALQVDTGDPETDAMLTGHLPVLTAPGRTTMVRVQA